MKIIGISGSLRKASYNTGILRTLQELALEDVEITIADISTFPLYNSDVQQEGFPDGLIELADDISHADGVIITVPEYNYSVPGGLKNAIDWISRVPDQPFDKKPVAIAGASMGALGTSRSQYHLRQILVFLNAFVMNRPEVFIGSVHEKGDVDGNITDQGTREFLEKFIEAFIAFSKLGR